LQHQVFIVVTVIDIGFGQFSGFDSIFQLSESFLAVIMIFACSQNELVTLVLQLGNVDFDSKAESAIMTSSLRLYLCLKTSSTGNIVWPSKVFPWKIDVAPIHTYYREKPSLAG